MEAYKDLTQGTDAVAEAARAQLAFSLQFPLTQQTINGMVRNAQAATAVGIGAMLGIAMLNSILAPAPI